MQSPPTRPVPDGAVVFGGGLAGPYPSRAAAQTGLGLENGAVFGEASTNGAVLEGGLTRRYQIGTGGQDERATAISVGLRGGAHLGPPTTRGFSLPGQERSTFLEADRTSEDVEGEYNESIVWGGVETRYELLATPDGPFASVSATGLLESQRPYELISFCSTPNPPATCDTDPGGQEVQVRTVADKRSTQVRLFVGAQVGYRFQWSSGLGLQIQVGGQLDPLRGYRGYDEASAASYDGGTDGWLQPGTFQVGLQLDGLLGL